ncbi:MAG: acyl-ACP--UDP-N-acetylglucosamine O-acyltransferase [Verrucomicrobiota bacterium]|jgi:UDP-N-acetylglucosamine acyltransferase
MIHPTAVVSPDAQLGPNVSVGPFAVVEAGAQIGEHSVVEAHAVVRGSVLMGSHNVVGAGTVLGGDPQDLRFDPATPSFVRIGHRNRIREHCTIHRATVSGGETALGDDCLLMVGSHLGHDSRVGSRVIFANGVMLGGFVEVQDQVFLGGGTKVHQFVKIGRQAMSQGNSSLSKNVPPYTMVALLNRMVGLNVVGLRRSGWSGALRLEMKRAFDLLYRGGLNVAQALEQARLRAWSPEVEHFWEFVEASKKRGLCAWSRSKAKAGAADGSED